MSCPLPAVDESAKGGSPEVAVLAGGCFWGRAGRLPARQGRHQRRVGLCRRRQKQHADYEIVSNGTTGHAESVRITYDPAKVSYGKILQIYFSVAHNPTELTRQGPGHRHAIPLPDLHPDAGPGAHRRRLHQAARQRPYLRRTGGDPRRQLKGFYPAEAYHQDFLTLHPNYPYIAINDMPKVEALPADLPGSLPRRSLAGSGEVILFPGKRSAPISCKT